MLPAETPEPIPLPDLSRGVVMRSLPAWLASRVASLTNERQPDPVTGKHRTVPTLPANSTLAPAERDAVEQHVCALERMCAQCPLTDRKAEEAMLLTVGKLMWALPCSTQNEDSAEARGSAFMEALDDVPAWAVDAARRRWYRGDCGKNSQGLPFDCHWQPAPADLRKVALLELWRVRERINVLKDVLIAEPLIEFTDEHRAAMRARLAELPKVLGITLVGYDGSGVTADEGSAEGANCGTQPRHSPA
jgi:hypothetical protein